LYDYKPFNPTTTPGAKPDAMMGMIVDATGTVEWTRGRRGWGGPAATGGTPYCNFQQNPVLVKDPFPPVVATLQYERDEAAADMFLNWVYVRIAAQNAIATPTPGGYSNYGFVNTGWGGVTACGTLGTPDPTRMPGTNRTNYMNTIAMPAMGQQFPAATATP